MKAHPDSIEFQSHLSLLRFLKTTRNPSLTVLEPRLCLTCWTLIYLTSDPLYSKDWHSKENHSVTNTFQVMALADEKQIVNLCKGKDRYEHPTGMVSLFKVDEGFE